VPGVLFLVCGFICWGRRPDTRIGPLMMTIGFAWYFGTFTASEDARIAIPGGALQGYYDPLLAWLVLAYPTGRLPSTAARLVLLAWFGLMAVRTVFRASMIRLSTDYDLSIPAEVERYITDLTLRDTGEALLRLGIAAFAVVVLVLILFRLRGSSGVGLRVAGPILLGGIALAVGIVAEFAVGAAAGSFSERVVAWDIGQALTVATASLVPIGFLMGLARGRLARGVIADLVVELGDAPARPVLRDVLARALHDPSLVVAYPVAGTDRFSDADGQPVELPAREDPHRATTRLEGGSGTVAVLVHDPALAEQGELVRSVAAAARLALENERLTAEVRTQLEEVRRSRARIVAAGDAERRRVERDLHDGAQQRLVTLALALEIARGQLDGTNPDAAATIQRAGKELELALRELRELARGLHPTILTEEGLAAAVEALAERSPVAVSVDVATDRCPAEAEATAYFVVAEALTNVARYSKASSAQVRVRKGPDSLVVEVVDDGIGGADPSAGSGLRGLDDRVAAIGGRMEVVSEPGAGTTIRAVIPCE
jgi:signal transduction histidine kinase